MTYHIVTALVGDKDSELKVDQFLVKWHEEEEDPTVTDDQAANLRAKIFGMNARLRGQFKKRGDSS